MTRYEGTNVSKRHNSHNSLEMDGKLPLQQSFWGRAQKRMSRVVGLRTIPSALQFGIDRSTSYATGALSAPLDGLAALKQLAQKREQQTTLHQQTDYPLPFKRIENDTHAAPLSPLRDRDIAALGQWFDRVDMEVIEANLAHCLLALWPAPCWEDDPFEFLEEFLEGQKGKRC